CDFAQTSWGNASGIQLSGHLIRAPASEQTSAQRQSWAWWTNLEPYQLSWDCSLVDLKSPKVSADNLSCAGAWQSPRLHVTNLETTLFESHVSAQAQLDVDTRAARLSLASDLDPHRLGQFLPESAAGWLQQFSWPRPPRVSAEFSVILPAWTNRAP